MAYVMTDLVKCFEKAEDEVSTWCARCNVASGCLKSPHKRLKVPVTSKTGTFPDTGSWIRICGSFSPPCLLGSGIHVRVCTFTAAVCSGWHGSAGNAPDHLT